MDFQSDLLVLGGGPAGASLALLARRAGLNVTLLERAAFPRDKVCGEFVSAEGCAVLGRLGVLEPLLADGATWMTACRISDRRGRTLDIPLPHSAPHGAALGVTRKRMDATILNAARDAGVRVFERWEALAPVTADDSSGTVVGMTAREVGSDSVREFRAPIVAGAGGRRSVLSRLYHPALGDPTTSGPDAWFGLKVHLAGDARLPDRVELHVFDGGYVGLGRVEDGRINLCLMITVGALRDCGGSPDVVLNRRVLANPAVAEAIGTSRACTPWKSVGPLRFGPRRATAAGAVLVGDAAGTIDPFCGEGMSHALMASELALPYVLQAAARGGLDTTLATAYQRDWDHAFVPVTRRVRRLGRVLESPAIATAALGLLRGPARPLAPRLMAATRTGFQDRA
jgi:flavin-dependent dehydrogenase